MIFPPQSEILVSFGALKIHYYGVILAFAIVVGIGFSLLIKKFFYKDVQADSILDLSSFLIIGATLGARLYYVFASYEYFWQNPSDIFAITQGGLSIHGALIGGALTGILWAKINKVNFLMYSDIMCFGVLVGQVIGRFGNYFNSEAFGRPCDLPFGLFIPIAKRPLEFVKFEYFHPTFLYESIWNIFVLIALFCMLKKTNGKPFGQIFFCYLVFYSVGRIIIEQIRIDSVLNIFGMPVAVFASVVLILIGIVGIYRVRKGYSNEKASVDKCL